MNARERKALKHFYDVGVGEAPKGAGDGSKALQNLRARKWIERAESPKDFGPVLYRITQAGRDAHQADATISN